MKRLLALAAASTLVLAGCGSDEPTPVGDTAPQTSEAPAEPVVYSLDDTVTVGDGVTISDMELVTDGCAFTEPPTRDAVKFQLLATVENGSSEVITEALWGSDFSFTDPEGLSVSTLDIAIASGGCENDHPRQFLDMQPGDERRAAVTLEAPAGATEMTYSTSLIEGAEAVTWDVTEEIAGMEVTTPDMVSEPEQVPAVDPAPAAAPTFVECYLADGTALMSDGSHTYVESCDESAGGPYLLEDGRSIYDAPPAPADTPAATYPGWHCDGPAYLCRDDQASGKTEGQQN